MAAFRVIFPRKVASTAGFWGGMLFQAVRKVSLTHSWASSRFPRMFIAIRRQYLPYLSSVSEIAVSDRARYSSRIS